MFKSTTLPFDILRQIDGQITRKRKRLTKVSFKPISRFLWQCSDTKEEKER
jgi:hypothetical protein